MEKEGTIARYEDYLMYGKKLSFSGTPAEKERGALDVIRYVITECLGWTPMEAMSCLTHDVAKATHIDVLVENYVRCPQDVTKGEDYDYVVHLAFPNEVPYNPTEKLIRMYKKIMSGDKAKLPKKYFAGEGGTYKASVLLLYVISSAGQEIKPRSSAQSGQ